MLKNITLSAEESLINKARKLAATNETTLNALFRKWLERLTGQSTSNREFHELMDRFSYVRSGGSFSREEMNERYKSRR